MLFSDQASQEQNQRETKIPGKHPGIDERLVIMKVEDKVGDQQRPQPDQQNKLARKIGCAAKKNGGQWGEIRPRAGRAGQGVAEPIKGDRQD